MTPEQQRRVEDFDPIVKAAHQQIDQLQRELAEAQVRIGALDYQLTARDKDVAAERQRAESTEQIRRDAIEAWANDVLQLTQRAERAEDLNSQLNEVIDAKNQQIVLAEVEYRNIQTRYTKAINEVAILTAERDTYHQAYLAAVKANTEHQNQRDQALLERDSLEAGPAALREALGRYGQHEDDCPHFGDRPFPCNCGFTKAMESTTAGAELLAENKRLTELSVDFDEARERIAQLEEALRPFTEASREYPDDAELNSVANEVHFEFLPVKVFRNAEAVLCEKPAK